jgi:hypothetical protein
LFQRREAATIAAVPSSVFRILAATALAAILAGCTLLSPKPAGRVEVTASVASEPTPVTAAPLNEVTIHLAPLKDPRNRWVVVFNDTRYLSQRKSVQLEPDGTSTASFLALRTGRRLIRFFELPQAERQGIAVQSCEVIVTIE